MAVHHPGLKMEMDDLLETIRRQVVATLQNAAVGSGGIRVYDGGWITIENGGLAVTGTQTVTGTFQGSGSLNWSGEAEFTGPLRVYGTMNVTGASAFGNTVDVLNALRLGASGYIEAGSVRIDQLGSYGGRIVSSGSVLYLSAGSNTIVDSEFFTANNAYVTTLETLGAKNFRMPHPAKPDHWLRHGATESPVSGIEYWGEEVLPESGELVVMLPDYFEALAKQRNRAVMVTARGFIADWGDIVDGKFTVTGTPGGRFSWLVKAERIGADFVLEERVYGPIRKAD